jgi:hypothetical protein
VKCSLPYKEDSLRLTIYVYYLWEMALNIDLDCHLLKGGTGKKYMKNQGEVNNMKAYIIYDMSSPWILNECYTSFKY